MCNYQHCAVDEAKICTCAVLRCNWVESKSCVEIYLRVAYASKCGSEEASLVYVDFLGTAYFKSCAAASAYFQIRKINVFVAWDSIW
jgi:hypothetical protein